jgi:6-phosphogluconate dehydrogenase
MEIGIVGLGRMGSNMARRLARGGAQVVAFDVSPVARANLENEKGVTAVPGLEAVASALGTPRVVWLMLPAGAATQTTLDELVPLLQRGDVVVDGANAYYKDSMQRATQLAAHGLHFADAGVSGGIWGLQNGYAIMLGGSPQAAECVTPFVKILAPAPDKGWVHCGPAGSGHFVKMVHNGIEYAMMQAFAEGLSLMHAKKEFDLDLAAIAQTWRHGSVVRSWLLDLIAEFLSKDTALERVQPVVADSGEGRWTALEAVELGIPAPVMSLALMMRFASQGQHDYAGKLLAMMRNSFGGHAIKSEP